MIKIYTGLKNNMPLLFFIAGVIIFLSIFFWGIAKAVQLLLPLLIILSYLVIIVFLLGILPATFFKDLRPTLCAYSMLMSHALAAATWMMSFFFVIKAFGFLGVFLAFLFQFLAPIALAGALLKGSWHIAGHLALWITFTYAMRFYSQWSSNLNLGTQGKKDIIDVDIVEVRGQKAREDEN
jgi:hypothetical protein